MSELWPTRRKAEENPLDDLMERIESLVNDGQTAELRNLVRDLGELTAAVRDLISQMEAKKVYGYSMKAQSVGEAMAEIKKRIGSGSKKPPQGREVLSGMALWIAEH